MLRVNKELEELFDKLELKTKEFETMLREYAAQHNMPKEIELCLTVGIVEKGNPENIYLTIEVKNGVKNNDDFFSAQVPFFGYA